MQKRWGSFRRGLWGAALVWSLASPARGGTVLHFVESVPLDTSGVVELAFSADGAQLYASDSAGQIVVLSRDAGTKDLSPLQLIAAGAPPCSPEHLVLSPDQRHLYVACTYPDAPLGSISVFARDPATGRLSPVSAVESQSNPGRLSMGTGGAYLYAPGSSRVDSDLRVFARDPATGALSRVTTPRRYYSGVDEAAVSADGLFFYSLSEQRSVRFDPIRISVTGMISRAHRDLATGLSYGGGGSSTSGLVNSPRIIGFSRDEPGVYVAGRGLLASFLPSDQALSGTQSFLEGKQGVRGLSEPTGMTVTPSAVYIASFDDLGFGHVVLFRRSASGATRYVETLGDVDGPSSIVTDPEFDRVYAAATGTHSLEVFREERVCSAAPRSDCHPPTRAQLSMKTVATGRAIRYRWQNDTTSFPLAGDPVGGSTYSLCLYQEVGGTPALTLDLDAPQGKFAGGRGWKRTADGVTVSRYLFRDRSGSPDGVTNVKLEPAGVLFRAGGANVGAPSIPPAAPLTVQVSTDFGECWTSQFDAADVRVADPTTGRFLARHQAP